MSLDERLIILCKPFSSRHSFPAFSAWPVGIISWASGSARAGGHSLIIHGSIPEISNGYSRISSGASISSGRSSGRYALGSIAAVELLFALSWRPDRRQSNLDAGLTTLLVWLPNRSSISISEAVSRRRRGCRAGA